MVLELDVDAAEPGVDGAEILGIELSR